MTRNDDTYLRDAPPYFSDDILIRRAGQPADRGTCAIAIMAKASTPGLVKTRLVPPLSMEQAADLNNAFLADILGNLALAGDSVAIAPYLAFGPPGSGPFFEARFPADIGLLEVWSPDFGDCLFRTLQRLLDLGYGSACVLNSDSPTLPTARLVDAARLLALPGDHAVLGPSADGGYYLLGVRGTHQRLFQDIAWSTDVVARQTAERAKEIGLELITLAPWYDVDDAETLRRLISELTTGPHDADQRYAALHAKAVVLSLMSGKPASTVRELVGSGTMLSHGDALA